MSEQILTRARVQTTGVVNGKRIFTPREVVFDADRIERNFIPASEIRPAQHRIFNQTYNPALGRHESAPVLITRVLSTWERCSCCGHHNYLSAGQGVCNVCDYA